MALDTFDAGTMDDLLAAVIEHSGLDRDELRDVARHGADAGWAGFTYYSETCAFYDAHETLILDLAAEEAEGMGIPNVAAFVASFNCADTVQDATTWKNALAWWALEAAAHWAEDHWDDEED